MLSSWKKVIIIIIIIIIIIDQAFMGIGKI